MLKKLRNPSKLLLFSIILFKISLSYREKKKNEKNENDLNFRIVNEKNEKIERLNVNINCRHFFFEESDSFYLKY